MPEEGQGNRTVWLVRHGDRLDFADPGWLATATRPHDPPLSPRGRWEAEQIGRRLGRERISHVFSSPFLRTLQTADAIAQALHLGINVEAGLGEWLNREWFPEPPEILPVDESRSQFPRIDGKYRSRGIAVYGETGQQALERSGETALQLISDFPEDFVIVGHGASVLGATVKLLGMSPSKLREVLSDMPYACLVKLVARGERWRLELPCDTSHLERQSLP